MYYIIIVGSKNKWLPTREITMNINKANNRTQSLKSLAMTRAWQEWRTGTYDTWSNALRAGWKIAKMERHFNCKMWEKGSHRRLYVNDLYEMFDFDVERFRNGNISHGTWRGNNVRYREAHSIDHDLKNTKVWYDLTNGKIMKKAVFNDDWNIAEDVYNAVVALIG